MRGRTTPSETFGDANGLTASGGDAGPNYTLVADDFPFHRLEDDGDRNSCRDGEDDDGLVDDADPDCFDTNVVTSSQGTFDGGFVSVTRAHTNDVQFDQCGPPDGRIFHVGDVAVRKVEPRNTPTMINAVFNHRNFWDGRANDIFNRLDPLGERGLRPTTGNANPGTPKLESNGTVVKVKVRLNNASLASQASGPPAEIDGEVVSADDALVAFLLTLTDDRVRYERAPFDHPQLLVPDGQPGDEEEVTDRGDGRATDSLRTIPAVGASGSTTPLGAFLDVD